MKLLALFLAIMATSPLAQNVLAQTVDTTQNGYISMQQSTKGVDVLPAAATGVDTLVYAAGAVSLVHNTNAPVPVATTASTVAMATSLAATPTPCPAGQALNAMDAKGNAVTCVSIPGAAAPSGPTVTAGTVVYAYSQPSIQAGDTVSGSQTFYASQANIPAGVLTVGSTIEVEASGTYNLNTAQESGAGIIWLDIGGIRVASGNFRTSIGIANNYLWIIHFKAIVRGLGPTGSLDPLLEVISSTNIWGGTVELTSFNGTAPVNTASSNAVQIEFIGASPNDTGTMRQMTVTVH